MKQAKTWGSAAVFFLVMTLLCGVLYTAVCTGIAQLFFPYQANGSIIEVDGKFHYEADQIKKDKTRTEILETYGFKVIRFENKEVLEDGSRKTVDRRKN